MISLEKEYTEKILSYENNHWWYHGRRDMITKLLNGYNNKTAILDIGCSGGALLRILKKKGYNDVVGIDISKESIKQCKKKGLKNVHVMNGAKTSFDTEQFDIIIASDILEHIKLEEEALKEWKRILKKNGKLLIFVPAFNSLWSNHDNIYRHYRRYTKKSLRKSLSKVNFKLEKVSYWNFVSFFPASLVRFLQRYSTKENEDQLYDINPYFNELIIKILKFENYLLTKGNFQIGLSVFAIANK